MFYIYSNLYIIWNQASRPVHMVILYFLKYNKNVIKLPQSNSKTHTLKDTL